MKNAISILGCSLSIGIVSTIFGFYFPKNSVYNGLTLIGVCILLGIAVKIMDQLIDEIRGKQYRIWIILLGVFIPTSMVYLALTEEPVVGMVIGTAVGLLIAGKLDHPMYIISVILFVILVFTAYILCIINVEATTFYIIPVAAMGSFLDEFWHNKYKKNKITTFAFKHRFFLKIFAFIGFILGFAQLIHLVGFLCFDIFYDIVDTAWEPDTTDKKLTHNILRVD